MSYLLPDESMADTVVSSFCHHINFFDSEESVRAFAEKNPQVFFMSFEEAVLLAHLKNRAQYGDVPPAA